MHMHGTNARRKIKQRKREGAGKNANKHLLEGGIRDIRSSRAACDENPICHAEPRPFIGYESLRRTSAPLAKVYTQLSYKTRLC